MYPAHVSDSSHDMTFAVVLASRTAIWACADRQLTDKQNPRRSSKSGVKIVAIETPDAVALLTYAGVGSVRDTQVSQWVYRTLRGLNNIPLERSLEHIADAGRRRLVQYAKRESIDHFFTAAAIRDGKHYVYDIDLRKNPPLIIRRIPKTRNQVKIGMSGSGGLYVYRYEFSRLKWLARLIRQYEREKVSAEFVARQLASLNVSISARARADGNNTVSPESIVIHRHPKGKRAGGRQWCFDANGNTIDDLDAAVPTLANGMPVSEITAAIMRHTLQQMRTPTPDGKPRHHFEAWPDAATTQALLDRIPDTPDDKFP